MLQSYITYSYMYYGCKNLPSRPIVRELPRAKDKPLVHETRQ